MRGGKFVRSLFPFRKVREITTAAGTFRAFRCVENDEAPVERFGERRSNSTMRKRRLPMKQIMPALVVFLSSALVSFMPPNLEAAEEDTGQAAAPVYRGGSWVYRLSNKLHSGSRSDLLPDGIMRSHSKRANARFFSLMADKKSRLAIPVL